jgi:hypothetical protein
MPYMIAVSLEMSDEPHFFSFAKPALSFLKLR